MTKILAAAVIAFASAFASVVQAGVLIEPYLGYAMGHIDYKQTATNNGGNDLKDDFAGTGLGLRLGYKILFPWIAVDYLSLGGAADPDKGNKQNYVYNDINFQNIYGVVGIDLPILIRAWVGAGVSTLSETGIRGSNNHKFTNGTSSKAGIGLTMIPFTSINFEYITNKYSNVDMGGGKGEENIDANFKNYDPSFYLISISIPLDL
jgi:hypothetical protein